ncbi:hypothetical protein KI387_031549, partial [Taxus chinensis]
IRASMHDVEDGGGKINVDMSAFIKALVLIYSTYLESLQETNHLKSLLDQLVEKTVKSEKAFGRKAEIIGDGIYHAYKKDDYSNKVSSSKNEGNDRGRGGNRGRGGKTVRSMVNTIRSKMIDKTCFINNVVEKGIMRLMNVKHFGIRLRPIKR